MKKFRLGKNMKYGLWSSIMTIILIAILVFVNLGVGVLTERYPLKADMTKQGIYQLSDYTKNMLDSLETDIHIYALYRQENRVNSMVEILEQYQRQSDRIKLELVSPEENPSFSVKYDKDNEGLEEGTIIFDSGERYQLVTNRELTNYSSYTGVETQLYAEQKFTQAIEKVVNNVTYNAYFLAGHGEDNGYEFIDTLDLAGYTKQEHSLAGGTVPEDCDVLFILSPKRDFTANEIEVLDQYTSEGGSIFLALDAMTGPLPRLEDYLKEWGVETANEIVYEMDTSRVAFNVPFSFYATSAGHSLLSDIFDNEIPVLVADNKPIYPVETDSANAKALMTTTEQGETRDLASDGETYSNKGKIPIAVTSEKGQGRIAVFGSSQYMLDGLFKESSLANKEVILNTTGWLVGEEENTGIRPKDITSPMLLISVSETWMLVGVVLFIPVIIIIIGIIFWVRRRNR